MANLIDPSKYVIVRAECMDKGEVLHAAADCPEDSRCPVWVAFHPRRLVMDEHGNRVAHEGCDRCTCGCKYWENDRCIDCGMEVANLELV